jgi:hypothetical protein
MLMKKPGPKSDHKEGDSSNRWSQTNVGKALDLANKGMSTVGHVTDWAKEKQRTEQTRLKSQVQLTEAVEKTAQARIDADAKIFGVYRDHFKNEMDHKLEMQRLADERVNSAALIRQRDKVLDKLLDNPGDQPQQLADSLRALLRNGDSQ